MLEPATRCNCLHKASSSSAPLRKCHLSSSSLQALRQPLATFRDDSNRTHGTGSSASVQRPDVRDFQHMIGGKRGGGVPLTLASCDICLEAVSMMEPCKLSASCGSTVKIDGHFSRIFTLPCLCSLTHNYTHTHTRTRTRLGWRDASGWHLVPKPAHPSPHEACHSLAPARHMQASHETAARHWIMPCCPGDPQTIARPAAKGAAAAREKCGGGPRTGL